MIEAFFDGLCEPNPGGVATYGYVVLRNGKKLHEGHGLACPPRTPQATNNVAEYTGLLKALEWLVEAKVDEPVVIRGDSDLVVKQLKGEYKVKSGNLAPLYRQVLALADQIPSVRYEWVPRDQNADADRLTNLAYAEYTGQALRAPTSDIMTVDLVIAAPPEVVTRELHKLKMKGVVGTVPGASRVQVDLPAQPDALKPLLALKRRLEGSL